MSDKNDIRTSILLNKKSLKNIKTIAAMKGITQQNLLKKIVDDWLNNCEEMKYINKYENKE